MSGKADLLVALHSSSDALAVGVQEWSPVDHLATLPAPVVAEFPLGRTLSTELIACVEQVLPASRWREIGRLAVAIGPGGFTGTRLTVVMARTLAQQLAIPLDGVGSFLLIARRLWAQGVPGASAECFVLVQTLPRHGLVAGCYGAAPATSGGVVELQAPRFFSSEQDLPAGPRLEARVEAAADVEQLLQIASEAARAQRPAPWQAVLPLYPTSPVELRP
jgi:tRNA threonylcarbamoyl adenosine modification protein YeaZ